MAIPSRKFTAAAPVDLPVVEQAQEPRESTFTSLVPEARIDRLLKYIDGFPWTVDYYGQILNTHSVGNHFDENLGDLSQSYVKIHKVIMYVDSSLVPNTDPVNNTTTLTGTAVVPLGIMPNIGDSFIARVDTGEDAIFTVTSVSDSTYRKNNVWIIEYSMTTYTNSDPGKVEALNRRVNEEYYFDDLVKSRRENHLVTKVQYQEGINLQTFLNDSIGYYFNVFRQATTGSIVIPGHDLPIADTKIVSFINKTVDRRFLDFRGIFNYTEITNTRDRDNLLTALILRQRPITQRFDREMVFVDPVVVKSRAMYGSPFFLNVSYVIHPKYIQEGFITFDKKTFPQDSMIDARTDLNYYNYPDFKVTGTGTMNLDGSGKSEIRLLPNLFEEDSYIVTPAFYEYFNDKSLAGKLSYVEVLIYRYVTGETLSREDLSKVVSNWQDWSPLHQFYILPVMWQLIRTTMGII